MDYVARQFINLAKKLRGDFSKSLATLHKDLQKQADSIDAAKECYRQQAREQPYSVTAEVRLPRDVQTQTERQHRRNYSVQVLIALATWGTFVAAVFYGTVAYRQWRQMIRSNDLTQSALVAVQRAFVDGQGTASKRFSNQLPTGERWVFEEHFLNDGQTPAIQVMQLFQTDESPGGVTEDRFIGRPSDLSSAIANTGTIGPRQGHIIGPILKSDDYVLGNGITLDLTHPNRIKPFRMTRELYFWGWVIYRDVFPNTPIHVTEFCQQLAGISVNPKEQTIDTPFFNCGEHNCQDRYCNDYQQLLDVVMNAKRPTQPSFIEKKDRTLQ